MSTWVRNPIAANPRPPARARSRSADAPAPRSAAGAVDRAAANRRLIRSWKRTAVGRVVCFVGSIHFAVPLMVLIALVMGLATLIESASDSATARRLVYGSWWFISLMALVCASLIFAVATRWPWRRKHIGFIIVHASLVLLIAGGFISLFTRVEGTVRLAEGQSASVMQQEGHELRLALAAPPATSHMRAGQSPHNPRTERFPIEAAGDRFLTANGLTVTIERTLPRANMVSTVANDGPAPFEAFKLSLTNAGDTGDVAWMGETMGPIANHYGDVAVRVLAPELPWAPPEANAEPTLFFEVEGNLYGPVVERRQAIPGWWVASTARDGERVEVILTNGRATFERHAASMDRPDESFFERITGDASSGGLLRIAPPESKRLTLQGVDGVIRVGYANGQSGVQLEREVAETDLPTHIQLGEHTLHLEQHFTRARQTRRLAALPPDEQGAPGIALRIVAPDGQSGSAEMLLGAPTQIRVGEQLVQALFAPREASLPFALRLDEFRKVDYPGEQIAMEYESDVRVHVGDGTWSPTTISMNKPLVYDGWKVYQASYIGDSVSIFSVMTDPGLPLTYFACAALCVGIVITFYSRSLSRPHPGINRMERSAS